MNPVRLIGVGSPFGGDLVGWKAIEALERSGLHRRFLPGAVETSCCNSPVSVLLEHMEGARAVILIDAMSTGAAAGTVRKILPEELSVDAASISTHAIGVPESLALAGAIGILPGTVIVYGIEVGHSGPDSEPQAELQLALPRLLHDIEADLITLGVIAPAYGGPLAPAID